MPDNHFKGDAAGPVLQAGTVHGGVHLSITSAPMASASVAMATRAAARIAMGPPQQLPPPGELLDRRGERQALNRVAEHAESTDREVVVLHGPAGIGKTSLAAWWLRKVRHHFPDGQLYADLAAEAGPAGAVARVRARWLRALGVPAELIPDDAHEQAALWRTITSGRRLAVLLDDITTAEQVLHLAPVTGLVVATCRSLPPELVAHRAWTLPLDPLAEDDAVELIQQIRGRDLSRAAASHTTHGTSDLAELRELARKCGFVPLALCVAAAAPLHAAALTTPTTPAAAAADEILEAVIASASQQLPEATARAYALLGAAPLDHFSVITAAAALGVDDAVAGAHLTVLQSAHLLTENQGRYRLPAAVRADTESAGQSLSQADHDAVFARVAEHYLSHAIDASRAARPTSPGAAADTDPGIVDGNGEGASVALGQGLRWLDREQDNLAALIHAAHRRGDDTTVLELVGAMWPACRLRLIPNELWRALDGMALEAADRDRDRDARARVRDRLAICLMRSDDLTGAARRLAEAEQLWRDPPVPCKLAGSVRRWGHLERARGDLPAALDRFEAALASYEQLSDVHDPQRDRHLALTRLDLAAAHLDNANPATALPYLEQTYEYFADGRYPVDLGRTHRYLGLAHTRTGDFAAAAEHLQTALMLACDLGEAELQAVIDARAELARAQPGAHPC